MDNRKELGATFDTEASKYDKMRPGYAPELFKTIFDYVNIGEDSRVVEVGSGSGQATGPVLAKGCELISVEYGENFSKVLKSNTLPIIDAYFIIIISLKDNKVFIIISLIFS